MYRSVFPGSRREFWYHCQELTRELIELLEQCNSAWDPAGKSIWSTDIWHWTGTKQSPMSRNSRETNRTYDQLSETSKMSNVRQIHHQFDRHNCLNHSPRFVKVEEWVNCDRCSPKDFRFPRRSSTTIFEHTRVPTTFHMVIRLVRQPSHDILYC